VHRLQRGEIITVSRERGILFTRICVAFIMRVSFVVAAVVVVVVRSELIIIINSKEGGQVSLSLTCPI